LDLAIQREQFSCQQEQRKNLLQGDQQIPACVADLAR
jgi:hypothetical protein